MVVMAVDGGALLVLEELRDFTMLSLITVPRDTVCVFAIWPPPTIVIVRLIQLSVDHY